MIKALNNWKVVLLSLVGATTFWFFNALNKNYDARISYPINFEFNRDSVVIMKPLPTTIAIDVSSGGWNLLRKTFWFNVTPINITLENPTEIGFYTRNSLLPIITEQLEDLKINYLVSDTIYIDIERKRTKRVALYVDSLNVNLADNHRITSSIDVSPDTILLIVPQSCYDTLTGKYPLYIESRGISGDYSREVDINLPSNKLTSSIPESVKVRFSVDKFERKSIDIPVDIMNFPKDSSLILSNPEVQIFYTVRQSKDKRFTNKDFTVVSDFHSFTRKDSSVTTILVYSPEEAEDIEVIPDKIKVKHVRR